MLNVTISLLQGCTTPQKVRVKLPDGLSSYLLTPRAREAAQIHPPILPSGTGGTVVLMVWSEDVGLPNIFARGFALPVEWRPEGLRDDCNLPLGLVKLARLVRDETAIELGWSRDDMDAWHLFLDQDVLGNVDLSGLLMDVPSAFAPLAGALQVALRGGRVARTVFATGRRSDQGIGAVEGLDVKMGALANLGLLGAPLTFFVPHDQVETARAQWKKLQQARELVVEGFEPLDRDVTALSGLGPYLRKLHVAPSRGESLQARLDYANLPYVRNRQGSREFFLNILLPDLADRIRRESRIDIWPERVALAVSKRWESVVSFLLTYRPKDVCLLPTSQTEKFLSDIQAHLARLQADDHHTAMKIETILFREADIAGVFHRLESWVRFSPEKTAVEVTLGTGYMSAIMSSAALRAGCRVFYTRHEVDRWGPLYGTEQVVDLTHILEA